MRHLARLLLIAFLATPCQGVEAPPKYLNTFGGLDIFHDSSKIADTDASALSNVLTDRGFLEKRPGSELFQTLLNGWSVQYLQEFISPSKTRYLIAHASSTVYASDTSAAFAKISTTTSGYNVDCVSAFGKLYCADGYSRPWSWDGTTWTAALTFPICTFLEFADERMYCANTDGNDSRVNASAYGDATNWTVPTTLNADDPNLFTFQRTDGEGITCFKVTPWGKWVGKKHSTHILKGQDNDTYYKRLVDPSIGCVDDRSVQMVDGWLMWLGLEGVYVWGGSGRPELISTDIDPEIKAARQLSSNKANWVNSTQADWQAGALDISGPGALVSATIDPGSITPSSWTHTDTSADDFAMGTLLRTTTMYGSNEIKIDFSTVAVLYDTFTTVEKWGFGSGDDYWSAFQGAGRFNVGRNVLASGAFYSPVVSNNYGNWQINFVIGQAQSDITGGYTGNKEWYYFTSDTKYITTTSGYALYVDLFDSWTRQIQLIKIVNGTHSVLASSTAVMTPQHSFDDYSVYHATYPFTVEVTSSGVFTVALSSVTVFTYTDSSFARKASNYNLYRAYGNGYLNSTFGYPYSDAGLDVTYLPNKYESSGTYTSQIFDTLLSTPVGGPLSYSETVPVGSTIAYSVRGSTAGDNTAWTDWALASTTTPGAYRMSYVDGKRYWQYKSDLSTSYSTQTPSIEYVTLTARTTAEYYSEVKYIGTAISSWLTFDANEQPDGGSVTYYTRSSDSIFDKRAAAPAWVAQGNHLEVTASTAPYYQWRGTFNVPSGSNTVTINDVTTNWQEGSAVPVASMVWDHRYHLCVMNSSTTIKNDRCWIYQRNKKWTHFDGPNYSALSIFNNEPLAGSANTDGKILKVMQSGVYNDDGVAIDAYWEGPDMTWDAPNHWKNLTGVWIDAQYQSGGTLDVGYAVNRGSVFTSTSTALDSTAGYVSKRIDNLVDGYAQGRYVRLRFGNDTIDEYLRLNTATIYGEIAPLRND